MVIRHLHRRINSDLQDADFIVCQGTKHWKSLAKPQHCFYDNTNISSLCIIREDWVKHYVFLTNSRINVENISEILAVHAVYSSIYVYIIVRVWNV